MNKSHSMRVTRVSTQWHGERTEEVPTSGGMIVVSVGYGHLIIEAESEDGLNKYSTRDEINFNKDGAYAEPLPYQVGDEITVEIS